jgi:hypothetical protein
MVGASCCRLTGLATKVHTRAMRLGCLCAARLRPVLARPAASRVIQSVWPGNRRTRPKNGLVRCMLLRPGAPLRHRDPGGLRQRAEWSARSWLRNGHKPVRFFNLDGVIRLNVHGGQRRHKRIHEPSPCRVGSASNWTRGPLATGQVSTSSRGNVDQSKHVWSPEKQPGIHAPLHIEVGIAGVLHVWRRKSLWSNRLQNLASQKL